MVQPKKDMKDPACTEVPLCVACLLSSMLSFDVADWATLQSNHNHRLCLQAQSATATPTKRARDGAEDGTPTKAAKPAEGNRAAGRAAAEAGAAPGDGDAMSDADGAPCSPSRPDVPSDVMDAAAALVSASSGGAHVSLSGLTNFCHGALNSGAPYRSRRSLRQEGVSMMFASMEQRRLRTPQDSDAGPVAHAVSKGEQQGFAVTQAEERQFSISGVHDTSEALRCPSHPPAAVSQPSLCKNRLSRPDCFLHFFHAQYGRSQKSLDSRATSEPYEQHSPGLLSLNEPSLLCCRCNDCVQYAAGGVWAAQ